MTLSSMLPVRLIWCTLRYFASTASVPSNSPHL